VAAALDYEDHSLTWSGRAVDIDRIEAELTKLRYLAAGEPDHGDGFAMRTSLVNMVVYAEDEDTAARSSRVIEQLAGDHPSRAIVLIARASDEESRIDASLAAHCHMAQGMEQRVCCEELTLRVSGRAGYHLRSIVVPLLIPDLPVAAWWTGAFPQDTRLIEEMCEIADHLVIDSARFHDQIADLFRIRQLAESHDCAVGDLNFERTLPWRELFDQHAGSGRLAAWLSSIKSVEVRYADEWGHQTSGQAFLFLAWLAMRCGWNTAGVSAHGRHRLTIRHDERRIPAYLEPVRYDGVDRGWLVTIKLAFEDERGAAHFSLSRTADPLHVTIHVELPGDVHEHHVRIEASDSQSILMQQLDVAPRSHEFLRLLGVAAPLIQAATF
jgi:glucose-6-phosphate dehydrogenase assembly protein OpcA